MLQEVALITQPKNHFSLFLHFWTFINLLKPVTTFSHFFPILLNQTINLTMFNLVKRVTTFSPFRPRLVNQTIKGKESAAYLYIINLMAAFFKGFKSSEWLEHDEASSLSAILNLKRIHPPLTTWIVFLTTTGKPMLHITQRAPTVYLLLTNLYCMWRLWPNREKTRHLVLNMPVWFVLICGIILERKNLPEIGKVAWNMEKLPKSCRASCGQP